MTRWKSFLFFTALACVGAIETRAANRFSTVCDTGCNYTSLSAAVAALPSTSATAPWTIRVLAGLYVEDATVFLDNKPYVTIVGEGDGASVIQASSTWFAQATTTTTENLLRIKDSDHVNIRAITFDAATHAPTNYEFDGTGDGLTGAIVDGSSDVRFEDAGIIGLKWGLKDLHMAASDRVDIYGSRLLSQYITLWPAGGTWYVWSSDVRAVYDLTENPPTVYALASYITGSTHFAAWATYFYGEGTGGSVNYVGVAGMLEDASSAGPQITLTGCTLHAELEGTPTSIGYLSGIRTKGGAATRIDVIGSELRYAAPATMTVGTVAGIHQTGVGGPSTLKAATVNVVGSSIIDQARDDTTNPPTLAGATHSDLIRANNANNPTNWIQHVGSQVKSVSGGAATAVGNAMQTTALQSGTAALAGWPLYVTVTLPLPLPNANYRVALSINGTTAKDDQVWVSGKTATTFTLTYEGVQSGLSVDWIVRY